MQANKNLFGWGVHGLHRIDELYLDSFQRLFWSAKSEKGIQLFTDRQVGCAHIWTGLCGVRPNTGFRRTSEMATAMGTAA